MLHCAVVKYLGGCIYFHFFDRMKTRILMFGWEFPPHNSGGLGVACFGLTKALSELGVEVLFVMPRKLDVSSPWARIIFAGEGDAIDVRAVDSILSPYLTSRSYAELRAKTQGEDIYGPDL